MLLFFLIWFLFEMSDKRCCVPSCDVTRADQVPLHSFPDPVKYPDKFRSWLYNVGGEVVGLEKNYIYKRRKVCHKHFEAKYYTWVNTLTVDAVPTVQMPAISYVRKPLADMTNIDKENEREPSTSSISYVRKPLADMTNIGKQNENEPSTSCEPKSNQQPERKRICLKQESSSLELKTKVRKLKKCKDSYSARLKRALKLSENVTFQKCLKKFTTLAALFTVMQFREVKKPKMGRRFTLDEKLMALSLYKQGPRAYRWLSRIFILPSPLTLSRLISKAGIKPGINQNIFKLLKKKAGKMKDYERLCTVLFDEIALTPHFDYNRKKDIIKGFVDTGFERKRIIADHAMVFMIRGVIKNYKSAVTYSFCKGTTSTESLGLQLKNVINELQKCGFIVLATICDQGSTNISTIKTLIKQTKQEYQNNKKTWSNDTFEINGQEIIPLYDTPHLMKGIRNNLISKNLHYTINEKEKVAKWDHIQQLYQENPGYKGIQLIKKLTEVHVNPKKMAKMKVKYATQLFSKSVGTNMGYLADKGILPEESKDTADILLFFDDLFDSLNGSYNNSRKKSGKKLLGPVTSTSEHSVIWKNAKKVMKSMKFVTKEGRIGTVPSIRNWIHTLSNIELLTNKIINEYNFKSIWMRHLNQDPIENFFGSIRSHGCRNNSPTPTGFESAFASLLVNNLSNHSRGLIVKMMHVK